MVSYKVEDSVPEVRQALFKRERFEKVLWTLFRSLKLGKASRSMVILKGFGKKALFGRKGKKVLGWKVSEAKVVFASSRKSFKAY